MCSKFNSRTDVLRYSQELIDFYADSSLSETGNADYCNHIDKLLVCGLTLKFHSKFSESYFCFKSDFTYQNDFFKDGDPNLLVIIFKGLVICETNILKNRANSVSPVNFVNNILTQRLSAALYNEVAEWAGRYYALAQVNGSYRPTFQPIVRTSGSCCSSCAAYSEIGKEDAELTYTNYKNIMQQRQDEKDFEQNKCPKCRQHKLKTNQTRWGNIRICSDYPQCDFTKRIENGSAQNLN